MPEVQLNEGGFWAGMLQTVKCIVQTQGEAVVRVSWNVIASRNGRLICHSFYAHIYGTDCHEAQYTSYGFVFGICGFSHIYVFSSSLQVTFWSK
jgi:hypothetical protein